jgi:tRNA modification GTPase
MNLALSDTIAALASTPGPGGRAVVRLSGEDVRSIGRRVVQLDDSAAWESATLPVRLQGRTRLSGVAALLPVDVWYWPKLRSYTGQPSIELHCVGAPPLVNALLEELFAHGARPARAGEFTLRAFLAFRIDLMQAEAVLGVIDAADQEQLSAALAQLAGGISDRIAALQESLLIDLADLEAGLDFVDEDIEFIDRDELAARLTVAQEIVGELLAQADRRMQTRAHARVVLAGLPNAGKSTLFNALVGREAAIVSSVRGTTRDWLRAEVIWDGIEIEFLDTAGRDESTDEVAASAQTAADHRISESSLILWCSAADLTADEAADDARLRTECERSAAGFLHVMTKSELPQASNANGAMTISVRTGVGLGELRSAVLHALDARGQHVGELLGSTAARCRDSLRSVQEALRNAALLLNDDAGDELIAVELRAALEQTGLIAGQVTSDDLLDRVFSRFCIGK